MRVLSDQPQSGSTDLAELPPTTILPLEVDWGDADAPGNASYSYVNEAGVPEDVAATAMSAGRTLDGRPIRDEIANALTQWSRNMNASSLSGSSLFFRGRYSMTTNVYDQMMQAADAVEFDDVLSAVADATEGLAFSQISFEMVDQDQEDIWNQIGLKLRLQTKMKIAWRELFKVSQVYFGIDWEEQTFRVRTPAIPLTNMDSDAQGDQPIPGAEDLHPTGEPRPGPRKRARRKQFALHAPSALTIWDPTKILPVGQLMFGRERFAYIATEAEHEAFMRVFDGEGVDPLVLKMFDGPYSATQEELAVLHEHHRDPAHKSWLWLFKRDAIFRHTLSRADYERFSSVRLKSVLPDLDIKSHLRASDRATLIGATNFIIVLKRGSDKFPARPGEVEQLREQSRVVARMPILVGDHRLSVEIVTPTTDHVLDEKRYNLIDQRLIMRALGTFKLAGGSRTDGGSGGASPTDDEIARGIESRRNDLADTMWTYIVEQTMKRNETVLTEAPHISFHPKRVVISLDPNIMKLVLQLRDRGDISRETELEEFQMDQQVEYVRRKREKGIDDVFKSSVPFSSPDTNPFQTGSAGGRPQGGGGLGSDRTPAAGPSAPKQPATPN